MGCRYESALPLHKACSKANVSGTRPPCTNPEPLIPPLLDWLGAPFHSRKHPFTHTDGTLPEQHSAQLPVLDHGRRESLLRFQNRFWTQGTSVHFKRLELLLRDLTFLMFPPAAADVQDFWWFHTTEQLKGDYWWLAAGSYIFYWKSYKVFFGVM